MCTMVSMLLVECHTVSANKKFKFIIGSIVNYNGKLVYDEVVMLSKSFHKSI